MFLGKVCIVLILCFSFQIHGASPQDYYVELVPFLDRSFQEGIENIGCQPMIIDIPQQKIKEIYSKFNRGKKFVKICEATKRWGEEFATLKEGPWSNTNYLFGIFDKSGPTHKKSRLIQGINCKISREYCDWVRENYAEELLAIPKLNFLFSQLMEVEEICQASMTKKVEEIAKNFPQIEQIFYNYRGSKRIPLSIRITRYDHTGNFCLPLHYDISVMSLILPSDDDPLDECLLIASPKDFALDKLRRPIRPVAKDLSQISAILISGALMPIIEIPIAPSPHAVLPHHRNGRYVIVVCCHVPNLSTSNLSTVLNDMQELPNDFKEKWGLF